MVGRGPDVVVWHEGAVRSEERSTLLGQQGLVVWFTGLSGSGKSTVARGLERRLTDEGRLVYVLDGDNVRHGLNADLGFSPEDRAENVRRLGHVGALFADCGIICLVAAISPYRADREAARQAAEGRFVEIHVHAPLRVCEARDTKGLYARARAGLVADFTGISAPYEDPVAPEAVVDTSVETLESSVARLAALVVARATGEGA